MIYESLSLGSPLTYKCAAGAFFPEGSSIRVIVCVGKGDWNVDVTNQAGCNCEYLEAFTCQHQNPAY